LPATAPHRCRDADGGATTRRSPAFDEAFWLPERGWYAVGFDADKCPIDSLASNIGHCP